MLPESETKCEIPHVRSSAKTKDLEWAVLGFRRSTNLTGAWPCFRSSAENKPASSAEDREATFAPKAEQSTHEIIGPHL